MSRSKGRTSNSVSLFPFLAVLVCAMGALIFLLLVTTRRIRHNAVMDAIVAAETTPDTPIVIPVDVPVAEPDEPPETPTILPPSAVAAPEPEVVVEERPDPNAKLEQLIAALARQRDEQQQEYEQGRRLVSAAQAKLADAETQLNRLKEAYKTRQAAALNTDVERQVARAEFTRLGEEIDKAVVHLRRMQQENATRSSKFTVVPFDGQSGTTRRPILIECTKNGLTFLQERITLTANEVDGFTAHVNPLLAGTRALVEHWSRKHQTGESDEGAPYVLLIVRPSGSVAYYAARNLLSKLSQETGYELVAGDRELNIPPPDPVATEACRRAIQQVLAERKRVNDTIAAARRGADDVLRFKRGGNGFEMADREPTLQERLGKPGFGREKGGTGGPGGTVGPNNRRPGNNNGNPATGGDGISRFGQPGLENGGREPFAGRTTNGGSSGNKTNGGGGTRRLPSTGEFDSPFARGNGREGFPRGSGAGAGENKREGLGSEAGARGRFGEGQFTQNRSGFPSGNSGASGNRTGVGADAIAGRLPAGGSSSASEKGTTEANSGQPGGGTSRTGDASQNAQGSGAAGGQRSGSSGGAQGQQPSGSGSATGSGPSSGGAAGGQPPSPMRTFGRTAGLPPSRSRSGQTRRTWGMGSVRNGIGFERETKISVTQETIRVGTQPEIEIARFKNMADLTEKVLDDLDRHARTWGVPPKNFHWVPVVHFLVSPGGNLYYERLNSPLKKLGVSSTVEYPLDSPTYRRRTE